MQALAKADDLAYLDMTFSSDIQQFVTNTTTTSFLRFRNMEVLQQFSAIHFLKVWIS